MAVKQTQQERQEGIVELIIERGDTRVEELSAHFNVSAMTLYRDLTALESRQIITRNRGVVSLLLSSISEAPFSFRLSREKERKEAVGRAAAKLISGYSSVFIDDSSTAYYALDFIDDAGMKAYITNSLAVSRKIADGDHQSLTTLGGRLIRQLDATFGPAAVRMAHGLAIEVGLFGAASIKDGSVFHPYSEVAAFKSELITRVSVPILVVTSTKFERIALNRIADVSDFEFMVVDNSISADVLEELKSLTNVIVAGQ